MTTISHNRRRRNFSPSSLALSVVAFAVIAAALFWRGSVTSLFWKIVAPVVAARNAFDATENARLRSELASTTLALASRDALYQENLLLKRQFGRDASVRLLLAAVLMRPPGTPYDTFIIDVGAHDAVHQGSLVSAGGTTYIGTISHVYADTSEVTLFSAPGLTYPALVILAGQGGKSVPLSLEGDGAGSLSAQVPSATPVSVGDSVVLQGLLEAFAGTVSRVDKPHGESFERVYVQLPESVFDLQFVAVRL